MAISLRVDISESIKINICTIQSFTINTFDWSVLPTNTFFGQSCLSLLGFLAQISSPVLLVNANPSSGAPDDGVGRYRGILSSGRFREEVRWLASDIVGGFKIWLV